MWLGFDFCGGFHLGIFLKFGGLWGQFWEDFLFFEIAVPRVNSTTWTKTLNLKRQWQSVEYATTARMVRGHFIVFGQNLGHCQLWTDQKTSNCHNSCLHKCIETTWMERAERRKTCKKSHFANMKSQKEHLWNCEKCTFDSI